MASATGTWSTRPSEEAATATGRPPTAVTPESRHRRRPRSSSTAVVGNCLILASLLPKSFYSATLVVAAQNVATEKNKQPEGRDCQLAAHDYDL